MIDGGGFYFDGGQIDLGCDCPDCRPVTYTLTIVDQVHPGRPPLTMNDAHRAHWTRKKAARERISWQVKAALSVSPVPRLEKAKVAIVQYAPDARRRDADSLGLFRKSVLDAIVRAGVLPDDNVRHVIDGGNEIRLDRVNPRIEILITPISEGLL